MDLVPLGKEQLGEVGAVLPVHARDEGLLHQLSLVVWRMSNNVLRFDGAKITGSSKVAVTDLSPFIVMVHEPSASTTSQPVQPANVESAPGLAVSVTVPVS